mmetsp:Transcript_10819/g.20136  ORF Transcript_10819/g.20136 Transcript_10819/m.20136 type:complete len:929 (+) Transcript_10819:69-2855(+)
MYSLCGTREPGGFLHIGKIVTALCVSIICICPVCVEASCYEYVGCYADEPGDRRDMPHAINSLAWASLTVGQCVSACRDAGYAYAGLQDGRAISKANCWCGNSYGTHGLADNSFNRCDKNCPGRPYDLCGGYNGFAGPNSIYKVQSEPELCGPGTCEGEVCQCGDTHSGMHCQIPGVCRWAVSYTWGDQLLTDTSMQEQYIREMLTWDGKFAAEGRAVTAGSALTCDHIDLLDNGSPKAAALFTAPSKESLHISMLALVVHRVPLAWHFMAEASDEPSARAAAVQRLEKIINSYEKLDQTYPGLGGWLPWCKVSDAGFELNSDTNVQLPALDNGQLVWSMISAAVALEGDHQSLAQRYYSYVSLLTSTVRTLFMGDQSYVSMTGKVVDAKAAFSSGNCQREGELSDPYEGELMIMFVDLTQTWADQASKDALWTTVKTNQIAVTYDREGLPNGPITVQRGWRFSAHELWKYLVLPYTDNELVARVLANGERARTWNSKLKGIPGLLASCYTADHHYKDVFGVPSISMGYTEPSNEDLMVTPYGAYPLILVDRGYGLAWHRAMLARPEMQCVLGSVEASQAYEKPPRVAKTTSWDTKVTADLAALGGTPDLTRLWMSSNGKLDRFREVVDFMHTPFFTSLQGENTPFAPPPGLEEIDNGTHPTPDFINCPRLTDPVPPPFTTTTTTTRQSSTSTTLLSSTSTTLPSTTTTTLLTSTSTTSPLSSTSSSYTLMASTVTVTTAGTTTTTTFPYTGFTSGSLMLNITAPNEAALTAVRLPDSAQCTSLETAVSRSLAQLMNLDPELVSASVQVSTSGARRLAVSATADVAYTINVERSRQEILADQLASQHPTTVSAFMSLSMLDVGLDGYSAQVMTVTAVADGSPCTGSGRMTCPASSAVPEHPNVLVLFAAVLTASLSLHRVAGTPCAAC